MKNSIKLLVLSLMLMVGFSALAQSNTVVITNSSGGTTTIHNAVPDTIGEPTILNSTNAWYTGTITVAKDAVSFVEGTTNSGVVAIEPYVLYNTTSHKVGGGMNVYFPVAGGETNSLATLGAGFGVLYVNKELYDGTLNARISAGSTLPLLTKVKYEIYAESGAGYNVSQHRAVTQAFAGFILPFQVSQNLLITIGVAVGTISDFPGTDYAGGGSFTFKW